MPIIIKDVIQGTTQWKELRLAVATASNFGKIITTKRVRSTTYGKYLDRLFDEAISGEYTEGYKSKDMIRGNLLEPEACKDYQFITGFEVEHVGFIFLNEDRDIGYSPDGLVGCNGLIEIKTALPHIQKDRLDNGWSEAEHKQQIQGGLYVSGRAWCDRISYCSNMKPLIERFYRDEPFIKDLAIELKLFVNELKTIVERYKI